ncbi:MAG: single-stranded DNA-binding protein [Spirochaetes bacterium]|nr:single-stranded DNA-binding protein [Spirochaetota bacterium]
MSDINSVTLVGRLTEKPILRYTHSGTPVTTLKIANNAFVKRQNSGSEQKANFFNIIVWNKAAENCAKYLDKGRQIAVQGRLQHRVWETQQGEKRHTIEVIANRVQFLGSSGQGQGQAQVPQPEETVPVSEAPENTGTESEVVEDFDEPLDDEEIPF